jgi:toxin ParE1/3/4
LAKFKLTNNALKDLSDIWNYTVLTWSERQADNYYNLIISECTAISKNPQIGKAYSEIHPDLKGKISSKHIIFYRELDNQTVEITRILHERMDFKNKLG